MVVGGKIEYAFGGTFVALLRGGQVDAHDIEIIVEPGGLRQTATIQSNNPHVFGITEHNDHIIVVREDNTYGLGVSIQFFELGTGGYPNHFIPPFGSVLRIAEHQSLQPTYYQHSLGFMDNDRKVPVLRSKDLLYQRLFRFKHDRGATQQLAQSRLKRDILDIKVFLWCSYLDHDEPFSHDIIPALTELVQSWKVFAEANFGDIHAEDVIPWMRLGLPLDFVFGTASSPFDMNK